MSTRWTQLTPLLLGIVFAALFVGPVLNEWGQSALGTPGSTAPIELWRIWAQAEHASGDAVRMGYPAATQTLSDSSPFATHLTAGLTQLLGSAVGGWNTAMLFGFMTLIGGTIWLAKRLSPTGTVFARITFVLAVVGATGWSPLLLHLGVGAISLMLTPLFLALLHVWMQPRAHKLIGVGVALTYLAGMLGPWPLTTLFIAMTIPMAVVMTRHLEGRDSLVRTALSMAPGLLVGISIIATHHSDPTPYNVSPSLLAPAWVHQVEGALVLPATASVALPSLGILILALAGVSARPRGTAGWLLIAAWGILLSAGTEPESARIMLPAHQMSQSIPALQQLSAWWMVAPLVSIPLGIAAMRGVEALHKVRRDNLMMGVLLLAFVDQTIPSVVYTETRTINPSAPTEVTTALGAVPAGAILQLPQVGNDRVDSHRLWQRTHQRAISTAAPHGDDGGILLSYLARLSTQFVNTPPARPSADSPLSPSAYMCAAADLATLHDLGFAAVLLDRKAQAHPAHEEMLRMVLGDPVHANEHTILWSIGAALLNDPPASCALPAITQD
jgi:hypothetical protein